MARKKQMIKVIRKKPGQDPEEITIEKSIEAFEAEVGGKVKSVGYFREAQFLCREDGALLGLKPNFYFAGSKFYGTVLLVGITRNGTDFVDVQITAEAAKYFMTRRFYQ